MVVFFADDYVKLRAGVTDDSSVARFYRIAGKLPLDLQMLLCNRMYGSPKDIVALKDSEPGFQWLARWATWIVAG